MTRVRRWVILLASAVVAVVGVVGPVSPAQADGAGEVLAKKALRIICVYVSHGTWTAADLSCLTGPDQNVTVPTLAVVVCENVLGGSVYQFGTFPHPNEPPQFGWVCTIV
jgi:hypothetical protein